MKVFAWICAGLMALAVIPAYADSGCSEKHENVSRFNPTELSDYQKCVFEWTGREAGTVGKNIWVQHSPGEFIHIPAEELRGESEEEIVKTVVEYIVHETVRTQLVEIRTQIEVLKTLDISGELQERLEKRVKKLESATANASRIAERVFGPTTVEYLNGQFGSDEDIVITINGRDYTIADDARVTGQYNSSNASVTIRDMNLATFVGEIRQQMEQAYNDGYKDGYAAGYRDGWDDAVEAMNGR